jgi:hypothetical protein
VMSSSAAALLGGLVLLAWALSEWDPPGDEAAYGFGLFMALLVGVATEIAALGLGVVGTLQRRYRRSFALLGVACSVLVLASTVTVVGIDATTAFFASFSEPTPKVRVVSSGSE